MKKFEAVGAFETNPHWEQIIKREKPIYKRDYDKRTPFERDLNRILHSSVYRRLQHKTQVFYSPMNDNICTRLEHVSYVSSISYTIAKDLGLNTEFARAIGLSHDVGHSPFGHKGGMVLSKISQRDIGETFWHERNGLYLVDNIQLLEDNEGKKNNLNLTYGVRDGIISHCGEVNQNAIKPREEAIDLYTCTKPAEYQPYTWEACIVKIADKISYLGRDIEDARKLGLLDEHEDELKRLALKYTDDRLTNSFIINTLITDLCHNSSIEEGLKFSDNALNLMDEIKAFNSKIIYNSELLKPSDKYFEICLTQIYDILNSCYDGINTIDKLTSKERYYPMLIAAFKDWLLTYIDRPDRGDLNNKIIYDLNKKEDYLKAVITYISGMTDNYAMDVYNELIQY